jgi:hypothetical protein
MALENFTNALLSLGPNDRERAEKLGIPIRTFMDYKAGRLPWHVIRLMRPDLLRALAQDAEQSVAQPA